MEKQKAVNIDKTKCIGCGKCVKDCVGGKLRMVDGKAEFMFSRCIECGHCYAICPVGAVSMAAYPDAADEKPVSMTEFDSEKLLLAMKSRRTIRQFADKPVSDGDIAKILEAGRYCPTGTNAQDFTFTVLRSQKDAAEKEAVKLFRTAQKAATPFSSYIKHFDIDDKFFFKGAPVVILVSSKGSTSGCLASSYMELMAYSLGLGVLYSGFFVMAAKLSKKLASVLKLEKGSKLVTCLVIGYPAVDYERIPPRKQAEVNWL